MGKKDEEYYCRKGDSENNVGEKSRDDDENCRFDYYDDSDSASSGDEDYHLYSNFVPDGGEETLNEGVGGGCGTDEKIVVVVDGAFLKGEYKETLLIATTQDENFNIFPSAYAVVDTRNDESWEWFFRQLSCVIPDDERFALISDWHKSIGNAIGKLLIRNSMLTCIVHMYASGAGLTFLVIKYNFTTRNIAESINKVMNPVRAYPIAELLDVVRNMLTRWFARKRKKATAIPTVLTKGVENLLEARIEHSRRLNFEEIDNQFQVTGEKTCSCRHFDLERIPSLHAITVAEKAKQSRIQQCHAYYRKDNLCNGNEKSIMPIDMSCIVLLRLHCINVNCLSLGILQKDQRCRE
ncbi:PREDICTED: uncharacterized protein LOC104759809 [Camelina sativa]|uniref:Uncharacterized protein LOC104759809 n=1 Tax=Camelina sativa TaxID=90675 RepID=A0ABM0X5F4_CAMSA|nr:PREDICTED: uncharacterized protein LOC104759809 [Camelina sativa]